MLECVLRRATKFIHGAEHLSENRLSGGAVQREEEKALGDLRVASVI